jgi:hypothetical protein
MAISARILRGDGSAASAGEPQEAATAENTHSKQKRTNPIQPLSLKALHIK